MAQSLSFLPHVLALALLSHAAMSIAASSASSASSEGSSVSVGSVSGSFEASSNSSSQGGKTAQGDYRIVDVAAVPERPGMQRVALQSLADDGPQGAFVLILPQATLDRTPLGAGQVITAQQRSFGVEFALREAQAPFFLVLDDNRYRELNIRAVTI
jgi:hypothetical protein